MDPQTPIALAIVAFCLGLFVWRQARAMGWSGSRPRRVAPAPAPASKAGASACQGCPSGGSCSKLSC